jgi:hypothetical protein
MKMRRFVSLNTYIAQRQGPLRDYYRAWLIGAYYGILEASIDISLDDNRKSIFCPPEKMTMTTEQVVDILDRYVIAKQKMISGKDWPLSLVLLSSLKETFPCK